MNKISIVLLMSLCAAGAYAQGAGGGITMSTDPAKAAAVEKHAQELKARPSTEATSKPATAQKSSKKTKGKTSTTHKSSTTKAAKPAKG